MELKILNDKLWYEKEYRPKKDSVSRAWFRLTNLKTSIGWFRSIEEVSNFLKILNG